MSEQNESFKASLTWVTLLPEGDFPNMEFSLFRLCMACLCSLVTFGWQIIRLVPQGRITSIDTSKRCTMRRGHRNVDIYWLPFLADSIGVKSGPSQPR